MQSAYRFNEDDLVEGGLEEQLDGRRSYILLVFLTNFIQTI